MKDAYYFRKYRSQLTDYYIRDLLRKNGFKNPSKNEINNKKVELLHKRVNRKNKKLNVEIKQRRKQ